MMDTYPTTIQHRHTNMTQVCSTHRPDRDLRQVTRQVTGQQVTGQSNREVWDKSDPSDSNIAIEMHRKTGSIALSVSIGVDITTAVELINWLDGVTARLFNLEKFMTVVVARMQRNKISDTAIIHTATIGEETQARHHAAGTLDASFFSRLLPHHRIKRSRYQVVPTVYHKACSFSIKEDAVNVYACNKTTVKTKYSSQW